MINTMEQIETLDALAVKRMGEEWNENQRRLRIERGQPTAQELIE